MSLWAKAAATMMLILNRSPTSAIKDQKPVEALKGEKPSVGHLRVFSCIGHVLINPQFKKKAWLQNV